MKTITLNIPESIQQSDFDIAMKLACDWFNSGILTSGQAAEMVGLSKVAFIELMGKYQGNLFNYDMDEIENDIRNVRAFFAEMTSPPGPLS